MLNKKTVCFQKQKPDFKIVFYFYLETPEPNMDAVEKTERYLQSVQVPIVSKTYSVGKKNNKWLIFNWF